MNRQQQVDLVGLVALGVWACLLINMDEVASFAAIVVVATISFMPIAVNHSPLQTYAVDIIWMGQIVTYGVVLILASSTAWQQVAPFGVLILVVVHYLKGFGPEFQWTAIGGLIWLPVSQLLNDQVDFASTFLLPVALYGGVVVFYWTRQQTDTMPITVVEDKLVTLAALPEETIRDLNAAASTIHAITGQQSGRAEQQTAAVEDMRVVLGDLDQLMRQSRERAAQVSTISEQAMIVSENGKHVIGAALEGMQDTQHAVKAVGHTIAQLALQLRRIGEIIASVSDIATQSNFLALNAQIEAARAGEQGRGFTVVADEVRAMADQSRQATDDVRHILKEIQQAVRSAVDVTEGGASAVHISLERAEEVDRIISQLHQTIGDSNQSAEAILDAAAHQLKEVGRLGEAIQSMDQAAMQNQASSRMAASVSDNLSRLSAELLAALKQEDAV